eukprot:TRINITY_DN242_c0_g4_i1.p1 TRINITY_DN242_c0_g4~~TRINITY_DN242_c0_g4_i1.p1  ORF type:complete len:133 (-),score=24.62 TRINITY_DN242_c0_g4_i1:239-637(-)
MSSQQSIFPPLYMQRGDKLYPVQVELFDQWEKPLEPQKMRNKDITYLSNMLSVLIESQCDDPESEIAGDNDVVMDQTLKTNRAHVHFNTKKLVGTEMFKLRGVIESEEDEEMHDMTISDTLFIFTIILQTKE